MHINPGGAIVYKKIYIVFSFLFCCNISAQIKFSEFLNYVNSLPVNKKAAAVDSLMTAAQNSGIPIIEDSTVYFIYRGNAEFVFIAGDFNEWDGYFTYMMKVKNTDLQYLKWNFPRDARTLYMIKEKNGEWNKDPYNPNYIWNGGSLNFSVLTMPEYETPWEISHYEGTPEGRIDSLIFPSSVMKKNYKIKIYLPNSYDEQNSTEYPAVYFQDGFAILEQTNAKNIFDNIIYNKSIQPTVAVFIEPTNRNEEYAQAKRYDYANFVANELVPFIDQNYKTIRDSHSRLIAGVSYGGTISGLISFQYPEVFSNCGWLSAVTYINNLELYSLFLNNDKKDIKFFSIWGTYEGLLPNFSRNLRELLLSKNYEFTWAQYNEGHNFGFWSSHIDEMLINFFPAETTTSVQTAGIPESFSLMQNYPNPFNPSTTINFTITNSGEQVGSFTTLKIYDVLGKEITTLVNEYKPAGNYKAQFNATNITSGVYFYKLTSGNFSETKKMILLK